METKICEGVCGLEKPIDKFRLIGKHKTPEKKCSECAKDRGGGRKKGLRKMKRIDLSKPIVSPTELTKKQKEKERFALRVRKNETIETWTRRVRDRKLLSEEEIEKKLNTYGFKILIDRDTRRKENEKTDYIRIKNKEEHYLRYYGIVMNHYCLRYGIDRLDFEICFYFYNFPVFKKEHLTNIALLITGRKNNVLKRFLEKGLIEEIRIGERISDTPKEIGEYRLRNSVCRCIDEVYKKLAAMSVIGTEENTTLVKLPKDLENIFLQIANENEEIKTGIMPQKKLT